MDYANQWEAKRQARAVIAAQLQATHPHLVAVDEKNGSLIAAAKNMRIELAAAFPGCKFTVKSKRYSGGNSISVFWTDGPSSAQVDAIIDRYAGGNFDGMTDSYTHEDCAWTDAFGDAKFVFSSREFSDELVAATLASVAAELGGISEEPTVAMYRTGSLWRIKQSGGCDYERAVFAALSLASSFPDAP